MAENNLVVSFENSLGMDITEFAADAVEFGVDLSLDDGLLKDIPFVGTAFKLYSIGNKVYDKHCLGKLYSFITEINRRNCSQEEKINVVENLKQTKASVNRNWNICLS